MNSKAPFFMFVIFITMLATSPMVIAYPSCGSHFFTKISYADDETTPGEAEKTSIFTTEDYRTICRIYTPLNCYELEFLWYDPFDNQVFPSGSPVIRYFYKLGVPYCVEAYFYISGEDRNLGQYRVELYAREYLGGPQYHLFTDYFQIYMNPCFEVNVNEHAFNVTVLSNSTISNFNFNEIEKNISLDLTGSDGTSGFCNVTIPEGLLWGEFSVYKDGFPLEKDVDYTRTYNGTHYIFYINYIHTTYTIEVKSTEVIPEFPTWTSMLLILAVLIVAIVIYKRRLHKTPIH